MADHIDLGIEGIGPAALLGRGGSAFVYLAEQEDFGRQVAVKVLFDALEDDATFRRFDRECRAIGAVSDHPNIVVVHGRGLTGDDRPYLVMEYRAGGSLAESLAKRGRLTEAEVIRIGIKIGNAVDVAHAAGVLHRDVKPGNILLSAYNEPALADFGIARIEGAHKTTQQVFSASVAHASREVLDEGEPTAQSDVYALGSTLFELATGSPAFAKPDDVSMWAVINRVLSEEPPDPRSLGVGDGLAQVISKAMSHDPAVRHQSAADLVRELNELRSGRAPTIGPDEVTRRVDEITEQAPAPPEVPGGAVNPAPAPRPSFSRAGLLAGLAVLAIGTVAGAAFAVQRSRTAVSRADEDSVIAASDGDEADVTDRISDAGNLGGSESSDDRDSDRGSGSEDRSDDGSGAESSGSSENDQPPKTTAALAQPPQLVFPRAGIGPLDANGRYILGLDGMAESAGYRIVVDGSKIGDYQSSIPIFFPEPGRHQLQVQVALDRFVYLTDPVEIYVADAPDPGFRANLSAIRSRPESWPEALRQFDQLVLDGHIDLELSVSDRDDRGRFPFWNYYVDGFAEDKDAARAYCDSFELAADECFVAEVQR